MRIWGRKGNVGGLLKRYVIENKNTKVMVNIDRPVFRKGGKKHCKRGAA